MEEGVRNSGGRMFPVNSTTVTGTQSIHEVGS